MVKKAKARVVNLDGSRRKKPGPIPDPESAKTERLALRVHPDLMAALTERSRERGISRSQYIEKLLIGWVNLDPRNSRLDMIGKITPDATTPADLRARSPLLFAARWQKFSTANELIIGGTPPREWFEPDAG